MEPATRRSLVVKVTVGAEMPERCSEGFTVAAAATSAGVTVTLWLAGEAVALATPGRAAEFDLPHAAPLDGLLDLLLSEASVVVCRQCARRRGLAADDFLPGVDLGGATAYVDLILQPDVQVVTY